jgi:hypothetical protein
MTTVGSLLTKQDHPTPCRFFLPYFHSCDSFLLCNYNIFEYLVKGFVLELHFYCFAAKYTLILVKFCLFTSGQKIRKLLHKLPFDSGFATVPPKLNYCDMFLVK